MFHVNQILAEINYNEKFSAFFEIKQNEKINCATFLLLHFFHVLN